MPMTIVFSDIAHSTTLNELLGEGHDQRRPIATPEAASARHPA
jgi:hypothetical protein